MDVFDDLVVALLKDFPELLLGGLFNLDFGIFRRAGVAVPAVHLVACCGSRDCLVGL